MRVCLVGGIFDKPPAYRERHRYTPETTLADALEAHGVAVDRVGHRGYRPSAKHDIVHVNHFGEAALRAASQLRTPFVFTGHDPRVLEDIPRSAVRRGGYRFVVAMADGLVALSHRELAWLDTRVSVNANVRRIPHGFRHDIFQRANVPEASQTTVLCVAQLAPIKGIDILLRAIASLSDHRIRVRLVYQTAASEQEYRWLARRLGIEAQVEFVGFLGTESLVREYSTATVVVLPSRGESRPCVVIEALLCGTRVIASDVGGVRELLGPHGIVTPRGDVAALAGAIREVSERPPLDAAGRAALREFAMRQSSIKEMAGAHMELYEEVVRAGRRRQSGLRRMVAVGVGVVTSLASRGRQVTGATRRSGR